MRDVWERTYRFDFSDCVDGPIGHWLHAMDTLFADLPAIKHKMLFYYEHFSTGDAQQRACTGAAALCDAAQASLRRLSGLLAWSRR